jgi:hypothetical protein
MDIPKRALWIFILVVTITKSLAERNGIPQELARDGPANNIMGWPGLFYQASRFEPLCGNLGDDHRYEEILDISGRCTPPMDAFGNDSAATLGIYDSTGARIEGGVVGNGYETCLCFALSRTGRAEFKGGFCWWVDESGSGEGWWALWHERILAGNYRPNVSRSLPQCEDVDVEKLRESWSATAVQRSPTGTSTSSKF